MRRGSDEPTTGFERGCSMRAGSRRRDDGQLSVVGIAIVLVITAVLAAVGIGVFLAGQGNSGLQGAPGVGQANDVQAKTDLASAITAVQTAAAGGGYGSITAATLSAADPSAHFTSGPSTSTSVVSVAAAVGSSGLPVPTAVTLPGSPTPAGGGGGVTLAVLSPSGTCWFAWVGSGTTWYGAQIQQHQCQALAMASAPSASAVSSTSPGWQAGSFPTT